MNWLEVSYFNYFIYYALYIFIHYNINRIYLLAVYILFLK
jgi:hypothetical protein